MNKIEVLNVETQRYEAKECAKEATLNAEFFRLAFDEHLLFDISVINCTLPAYSYINDAKFRDCSFENVTFDQVTFSRCVFEQCTFRNCSFYCSDLRYSRIIACAFIDCHFEHANFVECAMDTCKGLMQFGPLGIHKRIGYAFVFKGKIYIKLGCWCGTYFQTVKTVKDAYAGNVHLKAYLAGLKYANEVCRLWL